MSDRVELRAVRVLGMWVREHVVRDRIIVDERDLSARRHGQVSGARACGCNGDRRPASRWFGRRGRRVLGTRRGDGHDRRAAHHNDSPPHESSHTDH